MQITKTPMPSGCRALAPLLTRVVTGLALIGVVMGSAVWTKRAGALPALVGLERSDVSRATRFTEGSASATTGGISVEALGEVGEAGPGPSVEVVSVEPVTEAMPEWDAATRWFDGRPVRPSRVILMKVTGYSPDARSCGKSADGQTATLHSVWTNGMRLVAADPKLLPYGTMLTVPGYADGAVVPVLDCGGAIKGARLDLLFATHEIALDWGVKTLRVTVWAYADGKPAPNPRKVR